MTPESFAELLDRTRPKLERGTYDHDTLSATIRAELKMATELALPPGTKVTLRKESYKSFVVALVAWEGAVFCDEYLAHRMDPKGTPWRATYDPRPKRPTLTEELSAAIDLITMVAERHNWYECGPYDDYGRSGYHCSITYRKVEHEAEHGLMLESNPKYAALYHDAVLAAAKLDPKVVKSVCGGTLADGGTYGMEAVIKLAARANGRPLEYDKARRCWLPVSHFGEALT